MAIPSSVYIHDPKIAYPDKDFTHMVISVPLTQFKFDKNFPYRLKDGKSKFMRVLVRGVILIIVKPFILFRYLFYVRGRKNYRIYRRLAKRKAMITICNHTTDWDCLMVMTSRWFKFSEFPIWEEGAEGNQGSMFRYAGGIVTPTTSIMGIQYAYEAMREVLKENKWLHVFPEAACWPFYPAIRTFKMGTFKLACEENLPILPMVVKYRRPNWLWRIFKKQPNAKLIIGEPQCPDLDLEFNERVEDLHHRCKVEMMNLLGLDEESNQKLRDSLPQYHVEDDVPGAKSIF